MTLAPAAAWPPATAHAPFSWSIRASCCGQCGAPVQGADGGYAPCPRCGAPVELRPRASFARAWGTTVGPQHPALRAQDGRPLSPPPGIQFLFDGGVEIPQHREHEARIAWLGARKRCGAMDVGAGEELSMLTRTLVAWLEEAGHLSPARALLEGALEVAPLPRQRSELLGMMTRIAARSGDLAAASAWLACFEPPQDLPSESELRVSAAAVATLRGDHAEVLRVLGRTADEVAIADFLDAQALLMRANALEREGSVVLAAKQLADFMARGPAVRGALEAVAAHYRRLDLCPQSLRVATAVRERTGRSRVGSGNVFTGCVLMFVGSLPFFILLGVGVDEYTSSGNLAKLFAPPLFSMVFVLIFGTWGLKTFLRGRRERVVFERGVRAQARVLGASRTGVRVNRVPEVEVQLEVLLQPPVRSAIRVFPGPGDEAMLMPGAMLYVRVVPDDPDLAVLDR